MNTESNRYDLHFSFPIYVIGQRDQFYASQLGLTTVPDDPKWLVSLDEQGRCLLIFTSHETSFKFITLSQNDPLKFVSLGLEEEDLARAIRGVIPVVEYYSLDAESPSAPKGRLVELLEVLEKGNNAVTRPAILGPGHLRITRF